MKLRVFFSLEHEIGNYLNSLYKFRWIKHGRRDLQHRLLRPFPGDFKTNLQKARNVKEARKVIKKYLSKDMKQKKSKYEKIGKNLEKAWIKNGDEIAKKLERIYGKKFPFKSMTVYLTSLPICPYSFKERWIFVYAFTPKIEQQLEILTHELNHFMFYYYYPNLKKELGKGKYESLKEALTVFTDPGNKKGYPKQRKLRNWLKGQNKTINEIIQGRGWKEYL